MSRGVLAALGDSAPLHRPQSVICGAPSPGGSLRCVRRGCDGGHIWIHSSVMEGEHEDEEY